MILKIHKAKKILTLGLKEHPILWVSILDTIRAMGYIDKNGTVNTLRMVDAVKMRSEERR